LGFKRVLMGRLDRLILRPLPPRVNAQEGPDARTQPLSEGQALGRGDLARLAKEAARGDWDIKLTIRPERDGLRPAISDGQPGLPKVRDHRDGACTLLHLGP